LAIVLIDGHYLFALFRAIADVFATATEALTATTKATVTEPLTAATMEGPAVPTAEAIPIATEPIPVSPEAIPVTPEPIPVTAETLVTPETIATAVEAAGTPMGEVFFGGAVAAHAVAPMVVHGVSVRGIGGVGGIGGGLGMCSPTDQQGS
jgi:hypothetical protein